MFKSCRVTVVHRSQGSVPCIGMSRGNVCAATHSNIHSHETLTGFYRNTDEDLMTSSQIRVKDLLH